MRKSRKILIIVLAVLTAVAVGFAVYCNVMLSKIGRTLDLKTAFVSRTPQVGDEFYLKCSYSDLRPGVDGGRLLFYQVSEEKNIIIPFMSDGSIKGCTTLHVVIQQTPDDLPVMIAQSRQDIASEKLAEFLDYKENGLPEDSTISPESLDLLIEACEGYLTDEYYQRIVENVTPYSVNATGVPNYKFMKLVSTSATVILGIVLLYAFLGIWLNGKKLVIGSLVFAVMAAAVCAVCFWKEIQTMSSIHEYVPGMYVCNITNDYKLDDILASDIRTADDMIAVGSKKLLGGFPLDVDTPSFGCSAFSCETQDGTHLFGRNYDYLDSDGMILYSDPEDGYASIAICDLQWVNMAGASQMMPPDSVPGRFILRGFSPYICVDGMNDQGVGICILTLSYAEFRFDTENPDTLVTASIRAVLDKCASTDEAVALLSSYDVHSMFDYEFHLFVTDKTGKSAVIEWVNGEFTVTWTDCVTNYCIATHEYDDEDRFSTMVDRLSETGGIMTIDEAMDLLYDVAQKGDGSQTEWSCVYDLDHFVLYIYDDCDRDNYYIVTYPESFA